MAQLPLSGTLSDTNQPRFRAEIDRIEKLLTSAPDKATITHQMARTLASAKQWPETIRWLQSAVVMKTGFDLSREGGAAAEEAEYYWYPVVQSECDLNGTTPRRSRTSRPTV